MAEEGKISPKDIRGADTVERRGKLAIAYFQQRMFPGQREAFGHIGAYVTELEQKIS